MLDLHIPLSPALKEARIGCSGCAQPAPFTIAEFEAGPVEVGWQLRATATETLDREGPVARVRRWDFYCPDCVRDPDPTPPVHRIRFSFRRG
jgi:hypothetical protein